MTALKELAAFPEEDLVPRLLSWFDQNARTMPWRGPAVPAYHTWVSEIMLQQTRVEAVIPYFHRFLAALPTIADLAAAEEDLLHKLWQGLGYYNRVKNMHRCAQVLVRDYGGELPGDFETLKTLPGIGEYTAGAIASIAFGQRVPAVDGNVLRVLSRVTGNGDDISRPETLRAYRALAARLVPEDRPGDFDQALMELGALVCLPGGVPLCDRCPLAPLCRAHRAGRELDFPVRAPKTARKKEERTVLLLRWEDRYYLVRRPESGLLSGLWEPYTLPGRLTREQIQAHLRTLNASVRTLSPLGRKKHIFTHIEWSMTGWEIWLDSRPASLPGVWATPRELEETYAIPGAYAGFLEGVSHGAP